MKISSERETRNFLLLECERKEGETERQRDRDYEGTRISRRILYLLKIKSRPMAVCPWRQNFDLGNFIHPRRHVAFGVALAVLCSVIWMHEVNCPSRVHWNQQLSLYQSAYLCWQRRIWNYSKTSFMGCLWNAFVAVEKFLKLKWFTLAMGYVHVKNIPIIQWHTITYIPWLSPCQKNTQQSTHCKRS